MKKSTGDWLAAALVLLLALWNSRWGLNARNWLHSSSIALCGLFTHYVTSHKITAISGHGYAVHMDPGAQ
jgi:hypothetical protein